MGRSTPYAHLRAAVLAAVSLAASVAPTRADILSTVVTEAGERIAVDFQPPPGWVRVKSGYIYQGAAAGPSAEVCRLGMLGASQVSPSKFKADHLKLMWARLWANNAPSSFGQVLKRDERSPGGDRGWTFHVISYPNGTARGYYIIEYSGSVSVVWQQSFVECDNASRYTLSAISAALMNIKFDNGAGSTCTEAMRAYIEAQRRLCISTDPIQHAICLSRLRTC